MRGDQQYRSHWPIDDEIRCIVCSKNSKQPRLTSVHDRNQVSILDLSEQTLISLNSLSRRIEIIDLRSIAPSTYQVDLCGKQGCLAKKVLKK